MNILINCSNLKKGGGIQVADSICRNLNKYSQHKFIVIVPSSLSYLEEINKYYSNVQTFEYNIKHKFLLYILGRDRFLDDIVSTYKIDIVFSIFGPIIWKPKCLHLCGFARAQLVLGDSPYYSRMNVIEKLKNNFLNNILKFFFQRSVSAYFTENSYITKKWKNCNQGVIVKTITNYYNQIFDHPELWKNYKLPDFAGFTFLCVTANYPHKNLRIAVDIAKCLKKQKPNFNFRFIFTINKENFVQIPEDLKNNILLINSVDIRECPSLYQQADVMFQPTLLECFTATYPEAMRMKVPIVTTDLEFAHGLCNDAAEYYSPLDACDAAQKLFEVSTDKVLRQSLIKNGSRQLLEYDNYNQRTDKIITLLEYLKENN